MKHNYLEVAFLEDHKKRTLNSINPFSSPASYISRLQKSLQSKLQGNVQDLEDVETKKTHIIVKKNAYNKQQLSKDSINPYKKPKHLATSLEKDPGKKKTGKSNLKKEYRRLMLITNKKKFQNEQFAYRQEI